MAPDFGQGRPCDIHFNLNHHSDVPNSTSNSVRRPVARFEPISRDLLRLATSVALNAAGSSFAASLRLRGQQSTCRKEKKLGTESILFEMLSAEKYPLRNKKTHLDCPIPATRVAAVFSLASSCFFIEAHGI